MVRTSPFSALPLARSSLLLFLLTILLLFFLDTIINCVPSFLVRAEELSRVLEFRGLLELKGWGRAVHILLGYTRSYDNFLALPPWHEPLAFDPFFRRKKVPAVKPSRPLRVGNTSSGQSSASQHLLASTQSTDQSFPARKEPSCAKKLAKRPMPFSASSSSTNHQQTSVLDILDNSFSSDASRPSPAMTCRRPRNIFDSLSDLPAYRTGKAPLSGPSSTLKKDRPLILILISVSKR